MKLSDSTSERIALLKKARILPDLIQNRAAVAPEEEAIRQYDRQSGKWISTSYGELAEKIHAWHNAFRALDLPRGARVAILLPNGIDHVCADQAALSNALVPVPLHANDTPGASAFVLIDSQASILVTTGMDRWKAIESTRVPLPDLKTVILTEETPPARCSGDIELRSAEECLETGGLTGEEQPCVPPEPEDAAAIVYTSGTTGKPKGVVLTHRSILANIADATDCVTPETGDVFLSFLPLSHTFERTLGYYLALGMGCTVAYARSILLLQDDFKVIRPTVIISVPRIYERVYAKILASLENKSHTARQMFDWAVESGWRRFCKKNKLPIEKTSRRWADFAARPVLHQMVSRTLTERFGGRVRIAVSGGAAINPKVARVFCGLGLPLVQGYGMTETSPVIAGNTLADNQPHTVGHPFSHVELRLGPDNEIQVRGPSIMQGYWNRPEATKQAFTEDGWLRTGDIGEMTQDGHLCIRGRLKEIIVTSTGEKVSPADLESAIEHDRLFAQTMVIGENRPFIACLAVVDKDEWRKLCSALSLDPESPDSLTDQSALQAVMARLRAATDNFPHYAIPRSVALTLDPWTIDNGLLTPTLKIKRRQLREKFADVIGQIYRQDLK